MSMNMIELIGINKIYRTNEIETQALENVAQIRNFGFKPLS